MDLVPSCFSQFWPLDVDDIDHRAGKIRDEGRGRGKTPERGMDIGEDVDESAAGTR